MIYKLLADLTVFIHFLWILFLIFGGYWGVRGGKMRFVHMVALVFAFFIGVVGLYCPLTYLEVWLRSRHDPDLSYAGSFIAHYMEELIYLNVPHLMIGILTAILCIFYVWLYSRKDSRLDNKA